jgi:tRNA-splicing ligase RtcB
MSNFEIIDAGEGRIIKAWRKGVRFEDKAIDQLKNTARLPFIYKWMAAMPDTHWGMGSTVGTVLPTRNAVVPAAVGVDIGCGMMAVRTQFRREQIADLAEVRAAIEKAVPHGRTNNGAVGDVGGWARTPESVAPAAIAEAWNSEFSAEYGSIIAKHPGAQAKNTLSQLGTLGTGNHFIEICADEQERVWIVLHSGSRGLGNKIGGYFTDVAKDLCKRWFIELPDPDLAFLPRGEAAFDDYLHAVSFAQRFAWRNREIMMENIVAALSPLLGAVGEEFRVHCHHNYVVWESHFGENVLVTRKGAVRARLGDLGIIPGSMGARTYIVRGLGNTDSFQTCSHGAGRAMGRKEAVRQFSLADHIKATEGVECLKDASVLDETPGAYKDIEAVMAAQSDLVEPVYRLKQFVCVKGGDEKIGRKKVESAPA